jgi:hypothetical protein
MLNHKPDGKRLRRQIGLEPFSKNHVAPLGAIAVKSVESISPGTRWITRLLIRFNRSFFDEDRNFAEGRGHLQPCQQVA